MISRGVLGFGLLLSALGPSRPARAAEAPSAQAVDDARRADAKAHYEQGVAAYTSGRFKDAVDLFLGADRLSPSAPLSFNIARAYEKLGDDSGALRWYRDYLRRAPGAKNAGEVEELVRSYEARLQAKGVQQLTLLSTPPGATIAIDQAPVGVTPGTFDLAPGRHHVLLMLRDYVDAERDVELPADRAQDLSLELSPKATTPDAPRSAAAPPAELAKPAASPTDEKSHGLGIWPYLTLGAGAATLGGALVFELLRASSERSAEQATSQIEYKDDYDAMVSQRTTARVLAGVGAALVATGGVLLAIDLAGSKAPTTARLGVAPTESGFSSTLTGSF